MSSHALTVRSDNTAAVELPPGALMVLQETFVLYPTRLELAGDPGFEAWANVGPALKAMGRSSQWWLGDWVLQGEDRFGERFAQALEAEEYSTQGLKDVLWVCQRVHPEIRREGLSFEHHRKVAHLDPDEQIAYLDWAEAHDASSRELADHIRAELAPADDPEPEDEPKAGPPVIAGAAALLYEIYPFEEAGNDLMGDRVAVTLLVDPSTADALSGLDTQAIRLTVTLP